jgi:lactam utilization protein B
MPMPGAKKELPPKVIALAKKITDRITEEDLHRIEEAFMAANQQADGTLVGDGMVKSGDFLKKLSHIKKTLLERLDQIQVDEGTVSIIDQGLKELDKELDRMLAPGSTEVAEAGARVYSLLVDLEQYADREAFELREEE